MRQVQFEISNITATSDLSQKVNIEKIGKLGSGIHDIAIYGGRCGYVKLPNMRGKVTVFPSGKMISVGAKTEKEAHQQLTHTQHYLLENKLIHKTKLQYKTQNIVVTVNLQKHIPIERLTNFLTRSVYDPSTFPAIIYKILKTSYLIFQSGKIVITGLKSETEIPRAVYEINEKIQQYIQGESST